MIVAQGPFDQADADIFLTITEGHVRNYAHEGPPITLSVTLGQSARSSGRTAAISNGSSIESYYSTQGVRSGPLIAGMTPAEVAANPLVQQVPVRDHERGVSLDGIVTVSYSIRDASGKVLESGGLPLCPVTNLNSATATIAAFDKIAKHLVRRVAIDVRP